MNQTENLAKVCFIGGTRYEQPLNATTEKKFNLLQKIAQLYVIGFSRSLSPKYFQQYAQFYLLPELPHPILRYLTMFLIAPMITLWLIFSNQVNILICQSPYEGLVGALAKIIANLLGKKVVLVIENHGDFEQSIFLQRKLMLPLFYNSIMRLIAKFSLENADIFRAVSDSTKEQLNKWQPNYKVHQFVAWTDIEVFEVVGKKRENKFFPIVVYAGVIIERKGIIDLVNAFKTVVNHYSNAKLWLIGKEEDANYTQQIKNRIKDLQLEKNIKFLGKLTQQELAEKMSEAGIFVLPSYSEGLPRVIIEAMAVGLPVIATNVSGIPQVVKEKETGFLISPKDEITLSEKINWLFANPNEALSMGGKGYLFVKSFFSQKIYLQGYQQILSHACDIITNEN